MDPILLMMLVLIVAGVVIALYLHAQARRSRYVAAYARERGLSFDPDEDRDLVERYPGFDCLKQGCDWYAQNVMSGVAGGLSIIAFDYHYAHGSGKNRSSHRFSAVIAESPLPLEPLLIRRERILDRLAASIGLDDIDFESAEFSREFYVQSPDRRWAYDVIHPRMMEYLLAAPRFSVQLDTGHIIAWGSTRFRAADFDAALELIRGILDRLPDYMRAR